MAHAIAGAGLDVTEEEPVRADNPLLRLPKVIVTPHIAGASEALFNWGTEFAMDNVARLPRAEIPAEMEREVRQPSQSIA